MGIGEPVLESGEGRVSAKDNGGTGVVIRLGRMAAVGIRGGASGRCRGHCSVTAGPHARWTGWITDVVR